MTEIEFVVFDQQLVFGKRASRARDAAQDAVTLAIAAEEANASRFWVAEHHGGTSGCAAPDVLASACAARTSDITVGLAAMLVPYHHPIRIAGVASLLESLFPGRVELGLGRGPGAAVELEQLMNTLAPGRSTYEDRLDEVLHTIEHGYRDNLVPSVLVPQLRVMGASQTSAIFAARRGLPYCYASFVHDVHDYNVAAAYRENFVASTWSERPSFGVAIRCVWSDDATEYECLRELRRSLPAARDGLPAWADLSRSMAFSTTVGSPLADTVAGGRSADSFEEDLLRAIDGYSPDLVAVASACPVLEQRIAIVNKASAVLTGRDV